MKKVLMKVKVVPVKETMKMERMEGPKMHGMKGMPKKGGKGCK